MHVQETYQEDDSIEFGEMRGTYDLIYIWNRIKRALRLEDDFGQFKLAMLQRRRSSNLERSRSEQSESKAGGKEDSSQIRLLDSTIQDSFVYRPAEATRDDILERRALKREFITMHPMYDKSLWVFSPSNRFRRWCQLLVEPSRGERTFGTPPSETLSSIFIVIVFASVVVNVVLTAMNTPVYQKYQQSLEPSQRSKVYGYTDIAFTIIFSIEFIVRIIADGFLFTPNAYLLNPWNNLDFFVLLTLYIALFANLSPSTGWSRAFRAFKALRALRLINLLPSIKETLDAILVAGFPRMLDAAALSLCLLIPFALYGQNVFQGLFYSCNDNGVLDRGTCIGESQQTMSAPQPDTSLVYMPRVWANPYVYSFDSFWAALLILFEIVSGEGWVNVEITSMQIVGKNLNSQPDASQLNGIFFMVYNVAGSVFVLNLFLGVVIENFTKRNGTAYLTVEQRRWLDLKRLLRQVRPSKRPKQVPQDRIRKWCFDRATDKRGWFYTAMTVVIVLNIGVLCSEFRTEPSQATEIKGNV
ncbi:Ion transport protein-domain-containing protein [Jimgerdemannia flammicorona]|uniref:Ion transport protein-domain-containing protein n=1 Tax=Jimgerdemannia flammicorona TaxID=994334 RepID=A0A433Q460_9FUNG|nr:Ion transport protein-domain-containing protein [Jimgerdemannia flammicorona]